MDTVVLGLRVLLALACVIGLIWVLARRAGWGKGRRRPAGPAVEVVGRQALGRHAGVVVVAVGDRRLLLGYGEQHVTMLTELDAVADEEPDEEGAEAPAATPLTLGALAAAVLPTPRRARAAVAVAEAPAAAPAPAVAAAPGFEDALAAATAATSAASAASAAALATASSTPAAAVPGLVGLEVADVDPARIERLTTPAAGDAQAAPHGALHGSVLAPSTWKQAVAVLRERTVRR